MPTNSDGPANRDAPSHAAEPHGRAALPLVERLIRGVIERSVPIAEDAVEVIKRPDRTRRRSLILR